MQGQHQPQPKLFYQVTLDELVPQDDFYRILERAVDLSFVRRWTAHLYSYTGRPSVDPEAIIKLLLIAYLEGITSERQLMRQVQVNLAYRRYIGYDLEELVPDHSAISRNRSLFGKDLFQELFEHVVKLCIQAGLVAGVHQSVDATVVQANASMDSLVPREVLRIPRRFIDQVFEENPVEPGDEMVGVMPLEEQGSNFAEPDTRQGILELKRPPWSDYEPESNHSEVIVLSAVPGVSRKPHPGRASNQLYYGKTDPEATVAHPRGKPAMLAYAVHASVDSRANVITALETTNASVDDPIPIPAMLQRLKRDLGLPVSTVAADKRYGRGWFYQRLALMGIRPYIPRRNYGNVHKGLWGSPTSSTTPKRTSTPVPTGRSSGSRGLTGPGVSGTTRPMQQIAEPAPYGLIAPATKLGGESSEVSTSPTMPRPIGSRQVQVHDCPESGARRQWRRSSPIPRPGMA